MSATLDPQAKIDRAYEHFCTLDGLVAAFRADAYSIDMQPDTWTESVPPARGDVIIWAEAVKEPPAMLWGPIIGDIVHGLRSALDQLAWALSVDFQTAAPTPDPIPRGDPWRNIWFPIKTGEPAWEEGVRQQLWGIDPVLIAPLKQLQPFVTGQHAPDREPLAVLQELWNIDKHRHLHLVNATIELADVLSVEPFPGAPHVEFEVVSKRATGPLISRAEIGRAHLVVKPGGPIAMSLPQMHMNPRLAVDVAFDQGAPAHGGRVLHTLREIAQTVQAIIAAC